MHVGDWVTLGVLAACVGAVWLARRRGKAGAAAAISTAYAAGMRDANIALEASANQQIALALGGVHVNLGDSSGQRLGVDATSSQADELAEVLAWYRRIGGGRVSGLDSLPTTRPDALGVGGVFDGVERRATASDVDGWDVVSRPRADDVAARNGAQSALGR